MLKKIKQNLFRNLQNKIIDEKKYQVRRDV